jgi:hypothetical protein
LAGRRRIAIPHDPYREQVSGRCYVIDFMCKAGLTAAHNRFLLTIECPIPGNLYRTGRNPPERGAFASEISATQVPISIQINEKPFGTPDAPI